MFCYKYTFHIVCSSSDTASTSSSTTNTTRKRSRKDDDDLDLTSSDDDNDLRAHLLTGTLEVQNGHNNIFVRDVTAHVSCIFLGILLQNLILGTR